MVTSAVAAVVAHQGGWDEALFVAVPIVVLVALLALAQRRAGQELEEEQEADADHRPTEAPIERDER